MALQGRIQDLLKGGGIHLIGLQAKKRGARGSNFGPNVKKPTSWAKKGGPNPWIPPPPRTRPCFIGLLIFLQLLSLLVLSCVVFLIPVYGLGSGLISGRSLRSCFDGTCPHSGATAPRRRQPEVAPKIIPEVATTEAVQEKVDCICGHGKNIGDVYRVCHLSVVV